MGGKVLYRCWASGKYDMPNHQNMFLLAPRGIFLRLKIQIHGNTPQNASQIFANWMDGKEQRSEIIGPMYMERNMFSTPYNAYCQFDLNEYLSFCGITSDQLYQNDKILSWNEASKFCFAVDYLHFPVFCSRNDQDTFINILKHYGNLPSMHVVFLALRANKKHVARR